MQIQLVPGWKINSTRQRPYRTFIKCFTIVQHADEQREKRISNFKISHWKIACFALNNKFQAHTHKHTSIAFIDYYYYLFVRFEKFVALLEIYFGISVWLKSIKSIQLRIRCGRWFCLWIEWLTVICFHFKLIRSDKSGTMLTVVILGNKLLIYLL